MSDGIRDLAGPSIDVPDDGLPAEVQGFFRADHASKTHYRHRLMQQIAAYDGLHDVPEPVMQHIRKAVAGLGLDIRPWADADVHFMVDDCSRRSPMTTAKRIARTRDLIAHFAVLDSPESKSHAPGWEARLRKLEAINNAARCRCRSAQTATRRSLVVLLVACGSAARDFDGHENIPLTDTGLYGLGGLTP